MINLLVFTPRDCTHFALMNEEGATVGTLCCSGWLPRGSVVEDAPPEWVSCGLCLHIVSTVSRD